MGVVIFPVLSTGVLLRALLLERGFSISAELVSSTNLSSPSTMFELLELFNDLI